MPSSTIHQISSGWTSSELQIAYRLVLEAKFGSNRTSYITDWPTSSIYLFLSRALYTTLRKQKALPVFRTPNSLMTLTRRRGNCGVSIKLQAESTQKAVKMSVCGRRATTGLSGSCRNLEGITSDTPTSWLWPCKEIWPSISKIGPR